MERKTKWSSKGFTLVELLAYVAIVGFVLTVIAVFTAEIIKSNRKAEITRETQENARLVMQRLSKEIRWANLILDFNSSEITLNTSEGSIRFYLGGVDLDRLFIEKGGAERELTSDKVKITHLSFVRLEPENAPDSIQINLTVENRSPSVRGEYKATASLQSSVSLREN
jgi:type II secretory pathway pseudopilin PulG